MTIVLLLITSKIISIDYLDISISRLLSTRPIKILIQARSIPINNFPQNAITIEFFPNSSSGLNEYTPLRNKSPRCSISFRPPRYNKSYDPLNPKPFSICLITYTRHCTFTYTFPIFTVPFFHMTHPSQTGDVTRKQLNDRFTVTSSVYFGRFRALSLSM